MSIEYCANCARETGGAGRGDGSRYVETDGWGPLCPDCDHAAQRYADMIAVTGEAHAAALRAAMDRAERAEREKDEALREGALIGLMSVPVDIRIAAREDGKREAMEHVARCEMRAEAAEDALAEAREEIERLKVPVDARERIAKALFIQFPGRYGASSIPWEEQGERVQETWYPAADVVLAAIAGANEQGNPDPGTSQAKRGNAGASSGLSTVSPALSAPQPGNSPAIPDSSTGGNAP